MNILLIRNTNPYYESTASGNRFAGIINGLINQGLNVTLVVTGGYNNLSEYFNKGLKFETTKLNVKYTITLFNHNIWLQRINVYLLSGLINFISRNKLKGYFKSYYDIVWLPNNGPILNSFNKFNHLIKGKTIIELNEFNDYYKAEIDIINPLLLKKLERGNQSFIKAIDKIDLFLVMTLTLLKYYKNLTKNKNAKFFHFPMTVDLSRFKKKTLSNLYKKPYIAYSGTYSNLKDGVDILIHAFAQIADKYPDYNLYLAGFYHYDVSMQKELINNYKLNNRIIYLGSLDNIQIPVFIENAELLVLSRPDSYQAQGGFPTKLGEYLATGNPVCVTNVGEIPDYLEDNISAFIADAGNIDSFANAMTRAISNKIFAQQIGLNGKKVAEKNFNVDVQIQRLIKFLTDKK